MARLIRLHPPLMITALAMLALTVATFIGLFADGRELLGVPIWLKPMKFAISIAIYSATLAWLISLLDRGKRVAFWLGTVAAAALLIEIIIIAGQSARGLRSHFNNTTELNSILWVTMGATITIAWLATLWVAVLLLIQRISDRPSALAIRFGVFIGLAGMAVGFLMTGPTSTQLDAAQRGANMDYVGAHAVGVEDGGPGLPLVNWSTEAGDLRAGHFIGMHALQALPLFALLLTVASRRFARLRDEAMRVRLITVAGVAYAALVVLITWQALRGQSLVRPDTLTIAAASALVVLIAAATFAVTRKAATA